MGHDGDATVTNPDERTNVSSTMIDNEPNRFNIPNYSISQQSSGLFFVREICDTKNWLNLGTTPFLKHLKYWLVRLKFVIYYKNSILKHCPAQNYFTTRHHGQTVSRWRLKRTKKKPIGLDEAFTFYPSAPEAFTGTTSGRIFFFLHPNNSCFIRLGPIVFKIPSPLRRTQNDQTRYLPVCLSLENALIGQRMSHKFLEAHPPRQLLPSSTSETPKFQFSNFRLLIEKTNGRLCGLVQNSISTLSRKKKRPNINRIINQPKRLNKHVLLTVTNYQDQLLKRLVQLG